MPESESELREAQVNLTKAIEGPNQSSEEHKADYAQEGKPRSLTYLFRIYAIYYSYLLVHLSWKDLFGTLVAWS